MFNNNCEFLDEDLVGCQSMRQLEHCIASVAKYPLPHAASIKT